MLLKIFLISKIVASILQLFDPNISDLFELKIIALGRGVSGYRKLGSNAARRVAAVR